MDVQEIIRLKPAEGRRVRKPDGSLLAEAGEEVTHAPFWIRRLDAGDVEIVDAVAEPKTPAKSKD